MKTKEFEFNGNAVTFETERGNVMVNATEMAKPFGKNTKDFFKLEQTNLYIEECIKEENFKELFPFQEDISPLETRKNMIIRVSHGGRNNGTWMHRRLALKFAAWLNPAFEFWVFTTIDDLIFGSYKDDDESLKAIAKKQIAITLKEEQLEKSPLIKEIDELKKDIRTEQNKMKLRKNVRLSSFRSMFTPEEMTGEEKEEQ